MCPGIHQLLNKLQMGSEFTELVGSRGQYMLGDYGEILLNTTETYDRISLIMKIDSRVVKKKKNSKDVHSLQEVRLILIFTAKIG